MDSPIPGLLIRGTLADGTLATVEMKLAADSTTLMVDGPDSWLGVLPPESLILSQSIELTRESGALLMIPDDAISADGHRAILHQPQKLVFGHRNEAFSEAWTDAIWYEGLSDGEWVELRQDDETVARLAVTEGTFAGPIPPHVNQLVAVADGYSEGVPSSPTDLAFVGVGNLGQIRIQVHTEQDTPIPATLYWNDREFRIPVGGGVIPTGPGTAEAWIFAGPGYEAHRIGDLSPSDDTELEISLRPVITDSWLLALGVPSWPDSDSNLTAEHLTENLASKGVHFAVLVANDEVASGDSPPHLSHHIISTGGSRADSDIGQPFAWPWTSSVKRPAHGAAPWPLLESMDLLKALDKNGSRWTVIDSEWVQHAPPPWSWDPAPLALQIHSLDELYTVIELADQSIPIRVVGPQSWVEKPNDHTPLSESEIMAQLISGAITATNGPQIRLRVEGQAPGSTVEIEAPIRPSEPEPPIGPELQTHLEIHAPEWMPVRHAAIIGPGGEILRQWTVDPSSSPRLTVDTTIPARAWVAAICWGEDAHPFLQTEPAWALSGLVWIGRP